ncbi:MAG: hypothetical protein CMH42_01720 [Micrococcales bacterium]|nr:hypothetical protein [Micrococcales bacterium]
MGAYIESYRRSLDDPEGFWREAVGAIEWDVEPSRRSRVLCAVRKVVRQPSSVWLVDSHG